MRRPRRQAIDYKKLELVSVAAPESALQAVENLMVFDARCLDKETWHKLLQFLPELARIRKAWKVHFSVYGCVSCHRKKTEYGAGGFCFTCLARITTRMRTCFRKVQPVQNIPEEIALITRRYDAAQRLFNGDD